MKKRFTVLALIAILMLVAVMPASAGIQGPGVSGVQIQNLNTTDAANVTVELWNQSGDPPIAISGAGGDSIPAAAAKNYYLPNFSGVPSGSYAMVAFADQPIAAIARTDWAQTGAAALYSTVDPGTDVTVPLVLANFTQQTSQISIQNTDTSAAATDVTITLNGRGLNAPVVTLNNQEIGPGTSVTYNLGDSGTFPNLPNTGQDLGVSSGFVGSMRIQSSKELVVQSFIDLVGSPAAAAFTGVPTNSADTTLYCPLIRSNYYGDTGISIVNPNNSEVDVTITFRSDAGSPQKGSFTQNLSVAANSSQIAFQGLGGNSGSAGLPGGTRSNPAPTNNGFYGVAQVASTGGPVLAVVNDTVFNSNWSISQQSTYNCAPAAQAGSSFALPLVRNRHLNTLRLTTGIQVQNVTNTNVTVSLRLFNWDGTPQSITHPNLTIPPMGSGNFYQGNLNGLPTVPPSAGGFGWYGSALLEVQGAGEVIVVVNDSIGPGATTLADSANYNALLMP